MKKILFFTFFLIFTNFLQAQKFADKEYYLVDSLVLENLSADDSLLVEESLKSYYDSNEDTIKLASIFKIVDTSWDDAVWIPYNEYMYKLAVESGNKTNDEKELNAIKFYEAMALGSIAYNFSVNDQPEAAISHYQKSVNLFKGINEKFWTASTLNALGVEYGNLNNVVIALETYNESLKIAEEIKHSMLAATVLRNIVSLQKEEVDIEKALLSVDKAIQGLDIKKDADFICQILMTKADIYHYKKQDSLAYETAKESKTLFKEGFSPTTLLRANKKILEYLIGINDSLSTVKKLSEETIKLSQQYKNREIEAIGLDFLAQYYYKENDFNNAKKTIEKALTIATETNEIDRFIGSSIVAANIYEKLGLKDKQIEMLKLHYENKNELLYNRNKKESIKVGLQYEFDKQKEIDNLKSQQEIDLAESNQLLAEKKAQRNLSFIFAALALALLVGVIGVFLLYRAKQKKEQELLAVQLAERTKQFGLEKEVLVSKLKALRSQMNPHFIFNLLNSIQHLVLKGDIENSYNFINQFAGLVRSTLDYSDKDKIKLSEELEMLQVYLKLEKLRFNDNFEYKIIEQNTDKEVMMPPMLIQPFIENALVHGLLHKEGMRKLVVRIELTDVVVCTIEDNGVGRAKAKEIRERQRGNHKSFSTAAIEKRFAILSDYYKEELGYTYFDLPETDEMSTRVILRIPFDKLN